MAGCIHRFLFTIVDMAEFEWDESKNLANIRNHRIDFADVPKMFDSPMLIELDERFDMVKIAGLESTFCRAVWRS